VTTPATLVASSIPCNLCASTAVEQVRARDRWGHPLRSVICRRCGLVWSDPRPATDQVREFYARDYRLTYKGAYRPQPRRTYRNGGVALERFERVRPFLQPGDRVLDLGAGSGEVVYVLRALGYDATGLEPNEAYARYATDVLGAPVTCGFYQEEGVAPASLDVLTMFHTLEHLEDPDHVLRAVRSWLRSAGVLFVEVPNVEAVCQQPHQQFHRSHLYHFNLATLERLGQRAGYAVTSGGRSPDGGNIWVAFRKTDSVPTLAPDIPGNYDRVRTILRRHTAWRHALTRYPYIRPINKLRARLREYWATRAGRSGRELLDQLLVERGPRPSPSPVRPC
jgi:2-polyprenyl-3-methyl-5-hydroxy-6-metoxy-1,4-benzoquinol methylase